MRKAKPREDKLYYYNWDCKETNENDIKLIAVSEIRLPAPSRKFKRLHASSFSLSYLKMNMKVGNIYDIAIGDPIILRNCKIVEYNTPVRISRVLGKRACVLKYRDKTVWVDWNCVCLLSTLQAKYNRKYNRWKRIRDSVRYYIKFM